HARRRWRRSGHADAGLAARLTRLPTYFRGSAAAKQRPLGHLRRMPKAPPAAVAGALLASLLLALVAGMGSFARGAQPLPGAQPVSVGFTFSERQAGYLDVSWQQAYSAAMGLQPNLVRLAA